MADASYLRSMRRAPTGPGLLALKTLVGTVLVPLYWLLSYRFRVPGRAVRRQAARLGLRLLWKARSAADVRRAVLMLFFPLDSTRYFELEFAFDAARPSAETSYLDVSSPRILCATLLERHPRLDATLVNPDRADLDETKAMLESLGSLPRCRVYPCRIAAVPFQVGSFDLITSLSVVEHIQDDAEAIRTIWALLRPGGRLILTVPCAARRSEQYLDRDEYGLQGTATSGPVFWQRFYDSRLLSERIFATTGEPIRTRVFGERRPGLFRANATRKRDDWFYPFWREPYMVGAEYTHFDSIEALPGEGVVGMEFVKA